MAVIYLTGVLDDGVTVRDPAVPVNPRVLLEITQECSARVVVRVVNPGGVPIPTQGAGTFLLTVKKRPQDLPALATLTGTTGPENVVEFTFAASTLRGVPWGRYCYDIRLSQGAEQNLLIPTSPLQLLPAVSGVP